MPTKNYVRLICLTLAMIGSLSLANVAGAAINPYCTQVLSAGADVGRAVANAPAASIICLNAGVYNKSVSITSDHGTAGSPVTLTSTNPTTPATLNGRFVTYGASAYLNINELKFTWSSAIPDTMSLASDHLRLTNNDISGSGATICLNLVQYGGGQFTNSLVDHNLIHDCGNTTSATDRIHAQGIYTSSGVNNNVITNNWCYNVAARCYQIRGGSNTVWHNNTADDANWGVLVGDLAPTNNDFYNNIIGGDVKSYGGAYAAGGMMVIGSPSNGSGNMLRNNCLAKQVVYGSSSAVSIVGNIVTAVEFVDAAHHNYNLSPAASNNACRGDEVQGGNPGPAGSPLPTAPAGSPLPTAPASTHLPTTRSIPPATAATAPVGVASAVPIASTTRRVVPASHRRTRPRPGHISARTHSRRGQHKHSTRAHRGRRRGHRHAHHHGRATVHY